MQETTNFKFKKPDGTDNVDISVLNENMSRIDAILDDIYNQLIPQPTSPIVIDTSTGTVNPETGRLEGTISEPLNLHINDFYGWQFINGQDTITPTAQVLEFNGEPTLYVANAVDDTSMLITANKWSCDAEFSGTFTFTLTEFPFIENYTYYSLADADYCANIDDGRFAFGTISDSLNLINRNIYNLDIVAYAFTMNAFASFSTILTIANQNELDGNQYTSITDTSFIPIIIPDKCGWEYSEETGVVTAVSDSGTGFVTYTFAAEGLSENYILPVNIKVTPHYSNFVVPTDVEFSTNETAYGNKDTNIGLVYDTSYNVKETTINGGDLQTVTCSYYDSENPDARVYVRTTAAMGYLYVYDNAYWDYNDLEIGGEPKLKVGTGSCFRIDKDIVESGITVYIDVLERELTNN